MVPLHLRAPQLLQAVHLVAPLHALSDRPELERAGQAHDGLHETGRLDARGDPVDEGFVDLQRVDRQLAERAQRGVAGPEVVDGEPDAQ